MLIVDYKLLYARHNQHCLGDTELMKNQFIYMHVYSNPGHQ